MKAHATELPGVLLVEPTVHRDERGFFLETFHAAKYAAAGIPGPFVQDNHSRSVARTLRGLHAQLREPQGKLVRAVEGEIWDVAVDIRPASPTYRRWVGAVLSAENFRQLWVPPGFAHGFVALEDSTDFLYKCTDYYAPEHDRSVLWSDPAIGIEWPLDGIDPTISAKDAAAPLLKDAEVFA